jgi:hypothetical protein
MVNVLRSISSHSSVEKKLSHLYRGAVLGVVVAVAHASHRRLNALGLAAVPEGNRRVLRALVGVVNDPVWGDYTPRRL